MRWQHPESSGASDAIPVKDIFLTFLTLGFTSFGGPVAHIGYFRTVFVARRKWLTDAAYADLVALCQFLPGPASSQVGMAIGLLRGGYPGMAAAWIGFTLPSAIALVVLALNAGAITQAIGSGWLTGLKAAAVGVVAHALVGIASSLAATWPRAIVALAAAAIASLMPGVLWQLLVILLGAAAGLALPEKSPSISGLQSGRAPVSAHVATAALVLFAALAVLLPLLAASSGDPAMALIDKFYRAGALVFGGGHVVLPLLEAEMVTTGLVARPDFIAGYGAAQAVPGPLFTFAAYLGAVTTSGPSGITGAIIALIAIFLPSALLVVGALPFWQFLRGKSVMRRMLTGINAAVVGLLAAAFYDPVVLEGVTSWLAGLMALGTFAALQWLNAPSWSVVAACAALASILSM